MDYPGKVITKTQVTPTQTSASGNWTLDDQAAAIKNNNWPVALVPNPISKSLRFNSADSAYLNRTPASAGNRRTWTWSAWVKRTTLSEPNLTWLFGAGANTGNESNFYLRDTNVFQWRQIVSSSETSKITTTQVFRDVSGWYHFVIACDTTQATASNRLKLYVNGIQVDSFTDTSYPSQNSDTFINSTDAHYIGKRTVDANYCSAYLTEVNFIDGQALTPSDFGLTNPQTGQWIPKKYTGTYGTNGFYLNFKDATSTTTLGYDYSGNANNWTTNNFSVTAGSGNDSLTDVPTPWVAYNTTGDVGGVVRGNYCTLNPLLSNSNITFSNGNLDAAVGATGGVYRTAGGTIAISAGKWYFESIAITPFANSCVGVGDVTQSKSTWESDTTTNANFWFVNPLNGNKINGSGSSYGSAYSNGDIINCAVDMDNGKIWWGKNGTWFASGDPAAGTNAAFTNLTGKSLTPAYFGGSSSSGGATHTANFGQRPFAYTPPAGFRSLCTTNLPATSIGFGLTNQGDDYFNTVLYTGNGSYPRSITGVGFQPDFVWAKVRNTTYTHALYDSVRGTGTTKSLVSDQTDAEGAYGAFINLSSFDSDGFTIGSTSSTNVLNGNGDTFVAWNWKAGGTGVTNTAGTITSTVSANTTAGFSVVTFTSPSSGNFSVGHGLGVAPKMIITKRRDSASQWWVWHISLGDNTTDYLSLNTTNAELSTTNMWGTVGRDSSVMGYNSGVSVVGGSTQVAYCFAAVAGYSAFGSYTGNGSTDGPFVYLGFRPRYLLVKNASDGTANAAWIVIDSARSDYNQAILYLVPNTSGAEASSTGVATDFLSNGFKIRNTSTAMNANTNTIIYAAFAESPFQFANAR